MRAPENLDWPGPSRRAERCAGAALALMMPAGLIGLLVLSPPLIAPPPPLSRELIFILPRLVPAPTPAPPVARSAPFFAPPPVVLLPPTANAPFAAPFPQMRTAPVTPDLSGIGRALQDCNIDNYANLTVERRKLCPRPGEGVAVQQAPNLMGVPSQSKDEPHWAYEWQKKESPLLLPGARTDKTGITIFSSNGPSLLGGCGGPCTLYDIDKPAPEDLYKQEQADAAWAAAHKGAPGSPEGGGVPSP
jgi:hypothetical protein